MTQTNVFTTSTEHFPKTVAVDYRIEEVPRRGSLIRALRAQGQLTAEQERDFYKFQASCDQVLDSSHVEIQECRDGIDDEATLLRFFQARNCDASKAYIHIQEAFQARKANEVETLYRSLDVRTFEETADLYPKWTGRCDKRGLPIFMFDLAQVNSATISAHKATSNTLSAGIDGSQAAHMASMDVRRACAVHERLTRFVLPLCSAVTDRPNNEVPITKQIIIADISGISLKKLWNIKSYIQDFSTVLSTNYPEILDCVLVIGAPHSFSTIWSWAKKWIDPGTAAKLRLLDSKEISSTLSLLVDRTNIPQRYGGDFVSGPETWPCLDERISDLLDWRSNERALPPGPLLWIHGRDGARNAIAVGQLEGQSRQCEIATLPHFHT